MRKLFRLAVLGGVVFGAKKMYDAWAQQGRMATGSPAATTGPTAATGSLATTGNVGGRDTATGTDPNAKWSGPGYEDKSLGQAVAHDQQLVDQLMDQTHGDTAEAERRFRRESAGSPALERQEHERP